MDLAKEILEQNKKFIQAASELKELSDNIINASLYWNSIDEEKNPKLKIIRTLAGIYKDKYKNIGE